MEENNFNGLFVEPNAYVSYNFQKNNERKKIVFSEPYEYMPSYHMDNNFKPLGKEQIKGQSGSPFSFLNGLDLKKILPIAQLFLKKDSGVDVAKILSSFQNGDNSNLITSLISNPEIMKLATSFLAKNKTSPKTEMKSTDFEIKDYVKVD